MPLAKIQENARMGATRTLCVAFVTTCLITVSGCQSGSTGSSEDVRLLITPVPTPTATQAAQPTAAPVTYTVKPGDTLSGVADIFGVTVDDIVRSNSIADPNALQVGQALTIPGRKPAGGASPSLTPGVGASPVVTSSVVATGTVGTSPSTVTPVLVPLTVLPADATPPQGPTVQDPQTDLSPAESPTNSPTPGT